MSRRAADGFTLVEALAALTVMAVAMTAIGALANASMRSGLHVERHLALIETARAIIAGMPARKELGPSLTGALDGQQWALNASAYPNSLAPKGAAPLWRPVRVDLQVRAPTGETMTVAMIRLRKAAP